MLWYVSSRRDNNRVESPLSPAVEKMEALAALLTKTDLSSLKEIPEQDKASLAISASSNAITLADEPCKYTAAVTRVKKPKIPCRLPLKKDNITPCHQPSFTHFAGLKLHFAKEHTKEQTPNWPQQKGAKPEGYEDMEEDTGPLVKCM